MAANLAIRVASVLPLLTQSLVFELPQHSADQPKDAFSQLQQILHEVPVVQEQKPAEAEDLPETTGDTPTFQQKQEKDMQRFHDIEDEIEHVQHEQSVQRQRTAEEERIAHEAANAAEAEKAAEEGRPAVGPFHTTPEEERIARVAAAAAEKEKEAEEQTPAVPVPLYQDEVNSLIQEQQGSQPQLGMSSGMDLLAMQNLDQLQAQLNKLKVDEKRLMNEQDVVPQKSLDRWTTPSPLAVSALSLQASIKETALANQLANMSEMNKELEIKLEKAQAQNKETAHQLADAKAKKAVAAKKLSKAEAAKARAEKQQHLAEKRAETSAKHAVELMEKVHNAQDKVQKAEVTIQKLLPHLSPHMASWPEQETQEVQK